MTLRSQAARLRRRRWPSVDEFAQEVMTMLTSKNAFQSLWKTESLAPKIIERAITSDITINNGNPDSSLLTSRIFVTFPKNTTMLFWQQVEWGSITASQFKSYLVIDNVEPTISSVSWTVATAQFITGGQWRTNGHGAFPLRGGEKVPVAHTIDWRAKQVTGGTSGVAKAQQSRLLLMFFQDGQADIMNKL